MIIRDRQLSTVYNQLATAKATIDDASVLKLLAAVADTVKKNPDQLLAELSKPGLTRDQQVALVQAGMSKTEKTDLQKILGEGQVPMTPSARNFLEAVVGQSKPSGDPLKIALGASQKGGISGTAGANVTIEAINLTTAPAGRLFNDDTVVIGKTDQYGKFTGNLPDLQEGDVLRMRARDANGKVGEWVTIKASGLANVDTRNAALAVFRLGLTDLGGGKIGVANINGSRPLSEPGAKVQFTNVRSGAKQLVTLDSEGQLPKDLTLRGQAGDTFSLAVSDGINNKDFATEVGKVSVPGTAPSPNDKPTVDLKDPALHHDELDSNGKPRFSEKRFSGPLFKDGPKPTDVQQGQLGDCYFPAAMAALAQMRPDALTKAIKDNGDGTYTVTFKRRVWTTLEAEEVPNTWENVQVKVDGDLYVRSDGTPLYGASLGPDKGAKTMEMWFPLMEKAYAVFKGSYDEVGSGGRSSEVFEAVLGTDANLMEMDSMKPDEIFKTIKSALDDKRPVAAGTYGEEENAKYTNTGIYADHAYSVLGCSEKNGKKYVTLRNPWGESEPSGNGADDGIFDLKLEDFCKLYRALHVTGQPAATPEE